MRKFAIVVLFAVAGLAVGLALTRHVPPRYTVGEQLTLPANSRAAGRLAAVASSQHVPGVGVHVLSERTFEITGHGTSMAAARRAVSTVRKAIDRVPHPPFDVT